MSTGKDINYLQVDGTVINKEFPETTVSTVEIIDPLALLEYWQKRLRLQNWTIHLDPDCFPDDFTGQNRCGETVLQEVNKTAVIRILREDCYNGNKILPFNFEKTLVHELLHLKFCLLDNSGNDLQDRMVHQLIEELSRALTEKELI